MLLLCTCTQTEPPLTELQRNLFQLSVSRSSSTAAPRRPYLALASSLTLCWAVHIWCFATNTHTELISNSHSPQSTEHTPPPLLSSYLHALLAGLQFNFLFKFTCNFDTARSSVPAAIHKHINRIFMSRGVLHITHMNSLPVKWI